MAIMLNTSFFVSAVLFSLNLACFSLHAAEILLKTDFDVLNFNIRGVTLFKETALA